MCLHEKYCHHGYSKKYKRCGIECAARGVDIKSLPLLDKVKQSCERLGIDYRSDAPFSCMALKAH